MGIRVSYTIGHMFRHCRYGTSTVYFSFIHIYSITGISAKGGSNLDLLARFLANTVCRALSLYPLPDLIVAADKFEPFTAESHDCKVINPGEEKLIIRCSNSMCPRGTWSSHQHYILKGNTVCMSSGGYFFEGLLN